MPSYDGTLYAIFHYYGDGAIPLTFSEIHDIVLTRHPNATHAKTRMALTNRVRLGKLYHRESDDTYLGRPFTAEDVE